MECGIWGKTEGTFLGFFGGGVEVIHIWLQNKPPLILFEVRTVFYFNMHFLILDVKSSYQIFELADASCRV